MASPYAPMAVLVRRWDVLRESFFRRFPHMWIKMALGWAKAEKPDYHTVRRHYDTTLELKGKRVKM